MKAFYSVFRFAAAAVLLALLFCSCNVPDPVPTATPTPDWTATPVPPTSTPTQIPSPTPTPKPEYLDVPEADLEGIGLVVRYNLDGESRNTLEELVEKFNNENTLGITVRAENASSRDDLQAHINAEKKDTDLVIADSAWLRSLNPDGKTFLDLSPFYNDPLLSFVSKQIEPLMPPMLAAEKSGEKMFALPLWTEPAFLFYNKTWAIELGFPDTPADLASFAEQVCAAGKANYAEKDDSKHGTGGWIVSSDPEDVMSWLLVFTQNGETPGELLRNADGEIFENAGSWLRNLFDNGCAWNSRLREPYDYFANRYALFYSGTYSDAKRQLNAFDQSQDHAFDNWDLVVYPTRTAGNAADPRIYADAVSIAVRSGGSAAQTNAAWQFICWLFQETRAAELALSADGWPVQDNDAVTKLYRVSGKDKLYQTLSYRQYQVGSDADENWLTDQRILSDGFAYIFNPSAKPEDIPGIWEQIGDLIAEIESVNSLSGAEIPEAPTKKE